MDRPTEGVGQNYVARGWADTRATLGRHWILETFGLGLLAVGLPMAFPEQAVLASVSSLAVALVYLLAVFAWNLEHAPIRQRNEAWKELAEARAFIASLGAPKISVVPDTSAEEFKLRVRNEGDSAVFSAMATVKQKPSEFQSDELNTMNLVWLENGESEIRILKGATKSLILGRLREISPTLLTTGSPLFPRLPESRAFEISHHEPTGSGPRSRGWLRWSLSPHFQSVDLYWDVVISCDDVRVNRPYRYTCSLVIRNDPAAQKITDIQLRAGTPDDEATP